MRFDNVEIVLSSQAKDFINYLRKKGLEISEEDILKSRADNPVIIGTELLVRHLVNKIECESK